MTTRSESNFVDLSLTFDPDEIPIVCVLKAIPSEQQARYQELCVHISTTTSAVQELGDGYAFIFDQPEMIIELAEFISLERLCCPFLRFQLIVDHQSIQLHLTGREGVKEFLKLELGLE